MRVSDYIFSFLAVHGARHVFMLPGGGCLHLVDALGQNKELSYTCCLHEQAAAIAAGAHSLYTNQPGVALVTTGPGGTNAITGVAAAWLDSIPLFVLSGQVKTADMAGESGLRMKGFQEIDIVKIVSPITKYAATVTSGEDILYHLTKAMHLCFEGRPGPVWLDIPLDIQGANIEPSALMPYAPDTNNIALDSAQYAIANSCKNVASMLERSERPVILAGYGIVISRAEHAFHELIETLGIPVLTSWRCASLLADDHPLYFGRPGIIGQRAANFTIQNADLLISIGARMDFGQIGYDQRTFARKAQKVIVDIDQNELDKYQFDIDEMVCSDAGVFIKELTGEITGRDLPEAARWLESCKALTDSYSMVLPEHWQTEKYVSTYALIDVLSDLVGSDGVIVPGSSGACAEITMQAYRFKAGQRVINMPGLGAMGFGLPCAIGACIASGNKTTICINGDGGLQMNIQELETIARLQLPVKLFVLNNNGYGSIRNSQNNHCQGRLVACEPSSGLSLPDTSRVASAYGLNTVLILTNDELREKVADILDLPGPVICTVMVDPAEQTSPRVSSRIRPDGSIISLPLEDLWPFLDREEFLSHMVVEPVSE